MTISELNPMDLPAAAAWQKSLTPASDRDAAHPPPGYLTYIKYEVGLDRAFAVMRLLVPDFIELQGCVLLRGVGNHTPESFQQWWSKLHGDVAAIEDLLNSLPLWDLFSEVDVSPLGQQALAEFGRTLVLTWQAALSNRYPGRRFLVELRDGSTEHGPTVSFHSEA